MQLVERHNAGEGEGDAQLVGEDVDRVPHTRAVAPSQDSGMTQNSSAATGSSYR